MNKELKIGLIFSVACFMANLMAFDAFMEPISPDWPFEEGQERTRPVILTLEDGGAILEDLVANRPSRIEVIGMSLDDHSFDVVFYDQGSVISNTRYQFIEENSGQYRLKFFSGDYIDGDLHQILFNGLNEGDDRGTGVTGLEFDVVLYKNFKGWPINIVAFLGISQHQEKGFQDDFTAFTGGVKFEWTAFPWNHFVRTKVSFAEGINYATSVPFSEGVEVRDSNDGRDSKLLNYLGLGVSFNLGDILGDKNKENCYLGAYIYHRSGVFGTVKSFNNISGGSNFKTVSMECSF